MFIRQTDRHRQTVAVYIYSIGVTLEQSEESAFCLAFSHIVMQVTV